MRIIGGLHRGRALTSVGKGDVTAHLRPTSDRVRESLFNVLASGYGDPITGARVLDIFAGTGALGLEAFSRGAEFVGFIEEGRKAQALLTANIGVCRAEAQTKLFRQDARRLPANPDPAYDVVFLDPPYGKSLGETALKSALKGGWVRQDALIVWEENHPVQAPAELRVLESRKYGDTVISFLKPVA